MDASSRQSTAVARFRRLHEDGCFVIPNPWDAGSAIFLENLGFEALATTSAGFAFSRGLPDDPSVLPRDVMLDHIAEIAGATKLPVNGDFQSAYADDPEQVATNVGLCVLTGAAGLSIEDATGLRDRPLYDEPIAIERVKAARAAIDASGVPVVLTARCESFLVGAAEPERVALSRLAAFAEAGADCLFAPGVIEPAAIARMVKEVAPKPVNVLVSTMNRTLTVAQLRDLGVRRISVGGALARVAWGAFMRAARSIAEDGSFASFGDAAPFDELNALFER
ncbi:MAG TPA: isocitrate lyase/phosphoenolpyruvate mutase family protein [Candidatus Polarisedimenticolaceae bacterium]|nr:isocitrate lyase/phosphoenolpyruvate mutase family protein [Candidatus Polarisedimenticolaceae bacterium]